MEFLPIIPGYQPVPFPAPLWLLQILLVAGFFMHAIPMNVALTGGLVSGIFLLAGRAGNNAHAQRLGNALAYSLPFFVSFAITMGIVPLLFLQLVYGPLFYTSSILMAVPWFLVIFLLLVGYYSFYVYSYRRETLGSRAPWVLIGASLLFLAIAFFFTNNMTLMLRPEQWVELYRDDPYGLNLNWDDPQLIPRYLHFVIAATAVTSLVIGSFGVYWTRRDRPYGRWLIRTAALIFMVATLFQFPVGAWFMLSLPLPVTMNFLGHDSTGTTIFGIAMFGDFIALVSMFFASRSGGVKPFITGLVATLVVIALMIVMRHLVRVYMTQPFFAPENYAEEPQWILIGLFLFFAVLLIAYLAWLSRIVWQAFHPSSAPTVLSGETV